MPIYSFICGNCNLKFEAKFSIDKYVIPTCKCKSSNVYRDYIADDISVTDPQKTLGALADKNAGKSDDEKQAIRDKLDPKKKNYES